MGPGIVSAFGILIVLGILLAAAITQSRTVLDVHHRPSWPTDNIEDWLRHMTVTPFALNKSGAGPYVSPEGLAPSPSQRSISSDPDRDASEE
jgi:hypothetical protein